MKVNRYHTVCFSGYRPSKFSFSLDDKDGAEYKRLQAGINDAVIEALELGYTAFMCGMAQGFDLLCALAVIEIRKRKEYRDTQLIAVLPYGNHGFRGKWGESHRVIKQEADQEIIITQNEYSPNSYRLRNTYMVENSSHIICYWDGKGGGTAQTVRMAKKQGLTVHNVYNENSPNC